ncbi:MAG: ABC transporter permease subunit [Clostridia bacterium]|nr:ABC transporter permease subunit [Clostridia bacterium]MBQ2111418.1 ABC transporter permease subunit [Clostridia bacterium]MBQ2191368.1 ABC transporter permease subunit [Clostridia bacterium]MBQ5488602.1 ABC transporter permease subunit [Clostridia bacterium]
MKRGRGRKLITYAAVAVFWLALWQIAAMAAGSELLLPSPVSTAKTLWELMKTGRFWLSLGSTLLRVAAGFTLGVIAGTLLGAVTASVPFADALLSPLRSIIKATPVTSFIVLLLLYVSPVRTPVAVSLLMVTPIAWANVSKGVTGTDPQLLEMAKVFRFSRMRTLKSVYVPSVLPHFLAAVSTGFGFAWKSCVAAEVIALSRNSIGKALYESKLYLETAELFAWTAAIILISMALEALLVRGIGRLANDKR